MTTVITRPSPAKTIEVRELVFKVEGHGQWDVDEDSPHLSIEYLYANKARCPWCGHNTGRVEVGLHPVSGEPFETVVHCGARIQSPWWHTCGRPMLLVPEE